MRYNNVLSLTCQSLSIIDSGMLNYNHALFHLGSVMKAASSRAANKSI